MKFGLIGHPVSHSRSPELFRAAYPGRDDFSYDLIDDESFEGAWRRFLEGYDAVNVTAPFKGEAFRKVEVADTISRELLAVNILCRKNGRIYGYNSDFWAIRNLLTPYAAAAGGPRPRVLVIGCGGAAKAAALAALKLKMPVTVANRDFRKAREFCFTGGGMLPMRLEQVPDHLGSFNVFIYAIPVEIPLVGQLPLKGRLVVEPNYKDPCLRERCAAAGATYLSGGQWLCEQAITGYRFMTGIEPDSESVKACCDLNHWL